MSRVWNFSAGPSCLPEEVLRECAGEMMDFNGTGDDGLSRFRNVCDGDEPSF